MLVNVLVITFVHQLSLVKTSLELYLHWMSWNNDSFIPKNERRVVFKSFLLKDNGNA